MPDLVTNAHALLSILSGLAPYAVAVGSVVAWTDKYRSSKAIIQAKEAQIQSLEGTRDDLIKSRDAQVAAMTAHLAAKDENLKGLQMLAPPVLMESLTAIQGIMEQRIQMAEGEKETAEGRITELETQKAQDAQTIRAREAEKSDLLGQVKQLGEQVVKFKQAQAASEGARRSLTAVMSLDVPWLLRDSGHLTFMPQGKNAVDCALYPTPTDPASKFIFVTNKPNLDEIKFRMMGDPVDPKP